MSAGRVVQAGTPQEVYLAPATEFAADFLGVGTASRRVPSPACSCSTRTRQRLPYAGAERGPVVVVLRASDVRSAGRGPPSAAISKSRCFLGDRWRHYVRIGGAMLIVDGDAPRAAGPVRVSVSAARLRVYPRQGGSSC